METVITITTIHKPTFIEDLCKNINDNHQKADILIIGDLKTPDIEDYCKQVSNQSGIPIEYIDVTHQDVILAAYPDLLALFPYNTPDRVILGGMIAYLRGAKRIIAVDDDNFVTDSDFVGFHSITGTKEKLKLISNDSGWYNVHNALIEDLDIPFYPRGFPFGKRNYESSKLDITTKTVNVIVNQGLVLGDPDIDAITRLANKINAVEYDNTFPEQFGLWHTWSPFNYQNTSLTRDLIPCYYRPLSGLRNADIWTSYIFNRLAEHFGDVITFGNPLVNQIRNEHNLFDDLDVELQNNKETDSFVQALQTTPIETKTSYFDALTELLNNIGVSTPMAKKYIEEYRTWVKVIAPILES